jgi:hypothetical protein
MVMRLEPDPDAWESSRIGEEPGPESGLKISQNPMKVKGFARTG